MNFSNAIYLASWSVKCTRNRCKKHKNLLRNLHRVERVAPFRYNGCCANVNRRGQPASFPGQRLPVLTRLSSHARDVLHRANTPELWAVLRVIYEDVVVVVVAEVSESDDSFG